MATDTTPTRPALSPIAWALRIATALVFLLVGSEKFAGSSWVPLFAEIGIGHWFRYFTGAVQVTGAVLYAIPRTSVVGMMLLASTMAGAMLLHIFVLSTGASAALIPGALLVLVVVVWRQGESKPDEAHTLTLR